MRITSVFACAVLVSFGDIDIVDDMGDEVC
jgi:hypothetical protein